MRHTKRWPVLIIIKKVISCFLIFALIQICHNSCVFVPVHICCVNVFSDPSDYCEVLAQWAELVINRYEHLMSLATCEQHERYVDAQTCSLQSAATEICHSQVTFIFHSQGCCKMWLLELLLLMEATEKSKLCTSHFSLKKSFARKKKNLAFR